VKLGMLATTDVIRAVAGMLMRIAMFRWCSIR
jgi:hypothetical protein